MNTEQDRLIAILRYLEDWDKLNSTTVASVLDYRAGLAAFQSEVQEMPRIKLNVVGADNEAIWMEIPRLSKTPPPSLREDLKPWVTLKDDPKARPEHINAIEVPPFDGEEEGETILFDHELETAFDAYVEHQWVPWSESEAITRRCIALYEKVFHLQQTIENAGAETPIEIVWGMGMAVWNAKGQQICHPLVTQQVEILPLEGDMTLRLRPTTRDPQIETDPFLPLELPELPGFEKAARAFFTQVEATPSPFEPDSFSIIAKKAAGQLDTSGRYWPGETDYAPGALPAACQSLQVTDSWVVFARKRSTNFLVDDLKRLQDSIEEEGVPEGAPRHLVEAPEGALPDLPEIHFRGLSTAGSLVIRAPSRSFFSRNRLTTSRWKSFDGSKLFPVSLSKDPQGQARPTPYLQAIDGRTQILKVTCARHDAEVRLRRTYESVIEKRTWLRLIENLRLDRAISRAITAYVQAIRGMTKSGKGKRDVKLRHAAREAMHLASRGVPCWIMPHWRVSEALPPRLGDFDLVIVDEASQSDAWAVPCILRGKKVLIVGDDKQVGPQPSFTRQEQIDQIQERLKIAGLPSDIRNLLDPRASNYDLGELVFAGHTIRLREHFRCAEPIIEFSNKLCYDGEIKCVRVPTANERLLPTLVDVHVRTGSRDRIQKINRAEADAIVEEIAALVADDGFGTRSIGVVSLLGPDQGKLIFDSVLERIGEEAFLKHRIRCGDARTFQGSEADVIFISAVDDANSGAVMTHNLLDNIRRINVAVSRARDRLYFFHSFSRHDLGALDLRARLMDHFKAPLQGLTDAKGRELCESGFEREMFDSLCGMGYRVIPQVRAGNYRIDLVVEGHQGKRLAVECDGDQYHGPEKWMDDMGRQRLLERAGWKFWRCWGTSFARDKQGCLNDLVKTLRDEGIEPVVEGELDFSGVVEFREIGLATEDFRDFLDTDGGSDPPPDSTIPEVEVPSAESVAPAAPAHSIVFPAKTRDLFENDFSDLPLYRQKDTSPPSRAPSPTISIGDAVRYQISDDVGTREEYIMILNQPSNWKLGIVSSDEPIVRCLLGRTLGEKFEAEINGVRVWIEIALKHEVNT